MVVVKMVVGRRRRKTVLLLTVMIMLMMVMVLMVVVMVIRVMIMMVIMVMVVVVTVMMMVFSLTPYTTTKPWRRKWHPTPVSLPGKSQLPQSSWQATVQRSQRVG